jgi:uncharacterized delta-60 repeat protein
MNASTRARRVSPVAAFTLGFLSMVWLPGPATARSGIPSNVLDMTFGKRGVAITDLSYPDERFEDVALQSDGKIVAMGSSFAGQSHFLLRYRRDGRRDVTFHKTTHPFGVAMALQPDQKLVIGGTLGHFMDLRFALDRVNADGTVDQTFGKNGRAITRFPIDVWLQDVTVQQDGKIVAAGYVAGEAPPGFVFARYLPDGKLDRSFGSGGITRIQLTTGQHFLGQIAVQTDGKIVANGYVSENPTLLGLVRLDADGSLDPTFGDGGVVIMTEFDDFTTSALALQPDGGILSAGSYYNPLTRDSEFGLVRHLPDGTLDLGFGEDGLAHLLTHALADLPEGLALAPSGVIVEAGWSPDEGDENEVDVVWWGPDGSLLSDYSIPTFGFASFGMAVVVQDDGKAVVAGGGGGSFDEFRLGLARFLSS